MHSLDDGPTNGGAIRNSLRTRVLPTAVEGAREGERERGKGGKEDGGEVEMGLPFPNAAIGEGERDNGDRGHRGARSGCRQSARLIGGCRGESEGGRESDGVVYVCCALFGGGGGGHRAARRFGAVKAGRALGVWKLFRE